MRAIFDRRPPRDAHHTAGGRRSLAMGGAAVALSAYTVRRQTEPHDEGLMLAAAARLAGGQLPYRDFWANYPPGQPLVLAALRRARGPSLLHWRVMRVAVDALVSVLAHRLAAGEAPANEALMAWAGTAGAMAFPTGPGPNPPAIALTLAALVASPRRPRCAGALAGAAVAFRLELGVAAAAGVVARAPSGTRTRTAGVSLAVSAAALAPFALVAPREMATQTIGFLAIQPQQHLPLPLRFSGPWRPSKLIEFYMPVALLASLGLWTACLMLEGSAIPMEREAPLPVDLALAPVAVVGAGYLLGRTDEFHLVPLAAALPIMLAVAAARNRGIRRRALLGALVVVSAHGFERRAGQALHPPDLAPVPGPAGTGVFTSRDDASALSGLLAAVNRLTAPGEAIFVANPRHDLVRAGNPLLYTILDRPNATRYDVMQPGVLTTAAVQREIVGALDVGPVRIVVRWLDVRACAAEPNGAGRSSGVHILDEYLDLRYEEIERFGSYALLVRRPGSRPISDPQ